MARGFARRNRGFQVDLPEFNILQARTCCPGFFDLLAGKVPAFDLYIRTHDGHGLSNASIPATKIHQTSISTRADGLKDIIGIVNAPGLALQTA